ncbi:MAG TPA: efflux RND transporter periplasmic adaptor subunit [Terriglobia bacterium]|nr:efflux RND transporter periplasmic adaptor subunit [Terriglobia bacterium]
MTRTGRAFAILAPLVAIVSTLGYFGYVYYRDRDVVEVRVGQVTRMDLTQTVSANGEIKPKKYVNISSNAFGRIQRLLVKEGDRVKRGDLLIRLESIQMEADVRSAAAGLEASEADLEGMSAQQRSAEAAIVSARAEVARVEVEQSRAQTAFNRVQQLSRDGLISREQFDRAKSDLDAAAAQVSAARARLLQTQAQAEQTARQSASLSMRLAQQEATLTRARDQLDKTTIVSPLDGIITRLPVNEGEIAIVGVQNQPGTTLMTIADMSVITAEARVDETDIVNVKLGQRAEVKVDALAGRVLGGWVSEIGNSALASSNLNAGIQEAREFKVVITLDDPPAELRPGLSATAAIATAARERVVTIPIQALTVRELDGGPESAKKTEREGVFVVERDRAFFRPVKTGIAGTADIEVLEGVTEGETIVTGSFQALRALKDDARIRIEEEK